MPDLTDVEKQKFIEDALEADPELVELCKSLLLPFVPPESSNDQPVEDSLHHLEHNEPLTHDAQANVEPHETGDGDSFLEAINSFMQLLAKESTSMVEEKEKAVSASFFSEPPVDFIIPSITETKIGLDFIDRDQPVGLNGRIRMLAEPNDRNHDKSLRARFSEDTSLLMIPKAAIRLICYHLGVSDTKNCHTSSESYEALVAMMHCETVDSFMTSIGYVRVGEEDFDANGNRIAPSTHTWRVNNRSRTFITVGYQFYSRSQNPTPDTNITFCTSFNNGMGYLSVFSRDEDGSARLLEEHKKWAKQNNVLRGSKLRNINVAAGTFEEVPPDPSDTWDKYYYPKIVREILELEVFSFLDQTERYNKMGIYRRGILFYGDPGTGKTSIGKVCSNRSKNRTFIWVTPDSLAENDSKTFAVKKLYALADYLSPGIMYLEDLDLAAEDRDGGGAMNKGLGALMNVLDGINTIKNFVTVATTNRVELMEKALTNRPGRFDRVVEVPKMGQANRRRMFMDRLAEVRVDDGVIDLLVKQSDEWTGATMNEFVQSMNLFFLEANEEDHRHLTMDMAKRALGVMVMGTLKTKKASGFSRELDSD